MGAERLGHATALGLDPAAAIARRPKAHEVELVSERIDQIDYDLKHCRALEACGIVVDPVTLQKERDRLRSMNLEESVGRPYDEARIEENRKRQRFVLDHLADLGTVIESCPTSNLTIGAVPDAAHHPVHRFLSSGVNLAICSDDPGIFDAPLERELDWVLDHSEMNAGALEKRLGDPLRSGWTGTKAQVLEEWSNGVLEQWSNGAMEYWSNGNPGPRCCWILQHSTTAILRNRVTGKVASSNSITQCWSSEETTCRFSHRVSR